MSTLPFEKMLFLSPVYLGTIVAILLNSEQVLEGFQNNLYLALLTSFRL